MKDKFDYRIDHRMKVTALIPDQLIEEVRRFSGGKNITESLVVALDEWLALMKLKKLNQKLKKTPLHFRKGLSANKIRNINRR